MLLLATMDSTDIRQNQRRLSKKRKYSYDTGFEYAGMYHRPYSQYNWVSSNQKVYSKRYKRIPSRPPSPLRGTEEYRQRKIQYTSELIKRKLLTGEDISTILHTQNNRNENARSDVQDFDNDKRILRPRTQSIDSSFLIDQGMSRDVQRSRKTSSSDSIDVEEIHNKIMKYITNLNHGRKVNLINSTSSFYDTAIEQIQRQKRLELSRALRVMCSTESAESVDVINSIIPDIGIKLEDLPRQVIQQLSLTLNFDAEDQDLLSNVASGSTAMHASKLKGIENLSEEMIVSDIRDLIQDSHEPKENLNVGDSVTLEDIKQIKQEIPQEDDEFEVSSVKTELLEHSFVAETDDILQLESHKDSLSCNVENTVQNIPENVQKENGNHQLENHVGNCTHLNTSDDCIILPPEPIEVIEIDDQSGCVVSPISLRARQQTNDQCYVPSLPATKPDQTQSNKLAVSCDKSIQVDIDKFAGEPKDLNAAVHLMLLIDAEIERLTKVRQNLFVNLNRTPLQTSEHIQNTSSETMSETKSISKVCETEDILHADSINNTSKATHDTNTGKGACEKGVTEVPLRPDSVSNGTQASLDNQPLASSANLNVEKEVCDKEATKDPPHSVSVSSRTHNKSSVDLANGNTERVLRKLTKKYVGAHSPQALKKDRFNPNPTPVSSTPAGSLIWSDALTKELTSMNTVKVNINPVITNALNRSSPNPSQQKTSTPDKCPENAINTKPPVTTNVTQNKVQLENLQSDAEVPSNFHTLFTVKQKVMVAQQIGKKLFLGTEKGKVFVLSVKTGAVLKVICASSEAVTCFSYLKAGGARIYVGTLSMGINSYDVVSFLANDYVATTHSVLCMEREWGFLFIGCQMGKLYRYSLKNQRVEFADTVGTTSVMALKATHEGARCVLLVACRGIPITVRDAMSCLHMRTVDPTQLPTVYSMILHKGEIFCGTLADDLLVFSFHDGFLKKKLTKTNAKGISCLKIVSPLIFASCYDGYIYVYHTAPKKFMGKIKGPGGMILSMEVCRNRIFVGTNKPEFVEVTMPAYVTKEI